MTNKYIFSLLFLLLTAASGFSQIPPTTPPATTQPAQTGPLKVGYTNVEIILSYMPEAVSVEKELQTWVKKQEDIIEIKMKYYESEASVYQEREGRGNWANEEEKKAFETKLTNLGREIQQTQDNAEVELNEKRNKLLEPIQIRMQNAIDAVAKENGYSYILNQTLGGGIPSIIYGLDQFEVTDLIAAKLGITIPKAP